MASKQTSNDILTDAERETSSFDSGVQEGSPPERLVGARPGAVASLPRSVRNQEGQLSPTRSSGAIPKRKTSKGLSSDSSKVSSRPTPPAQSLAYAQSARPATSFSENDPEYLKYLQLMPDELRLDNTDILIINAEEDQRAAREFKGHLEKDILINIHGYQLRPRVKLLKEIRLADLDQLDFAFDKTLYVFLYVTKTFCGDAWSLLQGQACLTEAIRDNNRKWCVIPIHTSSKKTRNYKLPMMLGSLRPINYWSGDEDQFYIDGVRKLLDSKLNVLLQKNRELDEARKQYFSEKRKEIMENVKHLKESASFVMNKYLTSSHESDQVTSVHQAVDESGSSSQFHSSLSNLDSSRHHSDEVHEPIRHFTSLPSQSDVKAIPDENISLVQQGMDEMSLLGAETVTQDNINNYGFRMRAPAGNENEPVPSDIDLASSQEQQSAINSTHTIPRNEGSIQNVQVTPVERNTNEQYKSLSSVVVDGPASIEGEAHQGFTPYSTAATNHWRTSSQPACAWNTGSNPSPEHPTQAHNISSAHSVNRPAAQPFLVHSSQTEGGFLHSNQIPDMGYYMYPTALIDPFYYARLPHPSMQQNLIYYPVNFRQQYPPVQFPEQVPVSHQSQFFLPHPSEMYVPSYNPAYSLQSPLSSTEANASGPSRQSFPSSASNYQDFQSAPTSHQQSLNANRTASFPFQPVTLQTTIRSSASEQETFCKQTSGFDSSADTVRTSASDMPKEPEKDESSAQRKGTASATSNTSSGSGTVVIHHHHLHRKEINVRKATNVLIGDKSRFSNQGSSTILPDSSDDEDGSDEEISSNDEDDHDNKDYAGQRSSATSERSHGSPGSTESPFVPSQSIPSADAPGPSNVQTSVNRTGTFPVDKRTEAPSRGFPECPEPASKREPEEVSETEEMKPDLSEQNQTFVKQVSL